MIPSNEQVSLTNIGQGESRALSCLTDKTDCCATAEAQGAWHFPNGTTISNIEAGGDIYTSRGAGVVRLNRRNNATSPTGRFCCQVPNASSELVSVCINLVVDST